MICTRLRVIHWTKESLHPIFSNTDCRDEEDIDKHEPIEESDYTEDKGSSMNIADNV